MVRCESVENVLYHADCYIDFCSPKINLFKLVKYIEHFTVANRFKNIRE